MVEAFSALVAALQCANTPASSLPSFIFIFCSATLFYKILYSTRSRFLRRLIRSPLWNLLLLALLFRVAQWWMILVAGIDYVINYYGQKVALWCADEAMFLFSTSLPNLQSLPRLAQLILDPVVIKIFICTIISFSPLIVLFYMQAIQAPPYQRIIAWVDHRWTHTELGSAGYFLERPVPEEDDDELQEQAPSHASTGTLRHNPARLPELRSSQSI